MPVTLQVLRRFATEMAQQENPDFQVIGVRRSEGGDGYAEVIVMLHHCDYEPCRMVIGVDRTQSETDIRLKLAEMLRQHRYMHAQAS